VKSVRIIFNWLAMLTSFIWMPIFILVLEISLIKKCINTPKEHRCDTYRALFVGDRYWFPMIEIFGDDNE